MASARRASRVEADTESRILDAADRVFVRAGTAGARMQEIAREAGVNTALLHYYYRTKARLSEAVFLRAAGELLPAVIGIRTADLPIDEKVARVVEVELTTLMRRPYLPAYIISELAHHPERMRQLLATLTGQPLAMTGRRLLVVLDAQLRAEARAGRMRRIGAEQFVVNLLALCIFPFAARPMLGAILGFDDAAFADFTRHRRRDLPGFFLRALRP